MYIFLVLNYGVFATKVVVAVAVAIINSFIARKSLFKRLHCSRFDCRYILLQVFIVVIT